MHFTFHLESCGSNHCGGTFVCARCKRECGFCVGAADDYFDYCDDCATVLAVDIGLLEVHCVNCRKPAQGNYSIHRDGFGDGPELPLCDACGCTELPTCNQIWCRIDARGITRLKTERPDRRSRAGEIEPPQCKEPLRRYDPDDESMFEVDTTKE